MQQLRLDMRFQDNIIPADYSSVFLSYIKSAVKAYDPDIFKLWFGKGTIKRKTYTYSVNLRHPQFMGDRIKLTEVLLTVYLSCHDMSEYIILYNSLITKLNTWYPFKDNKILLENIAAVNIPLITTDSVIVKADSPILARNHQSDNRDAFLVFSDDDFCDAIKNTIDCALEGTYISSSGFEIIPVDAKKTVIYHYGMRVNANIGTYMLKGRTELLNYLVLAGIGSATNSGHGKIRVIGR